MQPLEPVLPPGLKESDFRQVLHVLESIVGRQNLFTGASLIEYIDPFQLDEGNKRNIPSVAVW
jgi:hypothetical protein